MYQTYIAVVNATMKEVDSNDAEFPSKGINSSSLGQSVDIVDGVENVGFAGDCSVGDG